MGWERNMRNKLIFHPCDADTLREKKEKNCNWKDSDSANSRESLPRLNKYINKFFVLA